MKKSKALIRLAAAFMAAIMALSLCACGDSRDNAASSGESSEEIQLTAEQQVEKLLPKYSPLRKLRRMTNCFPIIILWKPTLSFRLPMT